jgi:hypothetical protein
MALVISSEINYLVRRYVKEEIVECGTIAIVLFYFLSRLAILMALGS